VYIPKLQKDWEEQYTMGRNSYYNGCHSVIPMTVFMETSLNQEPMVIIERITKYRHIT